MHRRKSFLFRLFALLFALLLLITASVELALYHYARQVVGQEYIRLNQAGLRQISYTLGQGMTDTQTLAKRIAESTQLIELLSGPAGERADEAAPRSALQPEQRLCVAAGHQNADGLLCGGLQRRDRCHLQLQAVQL